jgi:hypothetical protein
MRGSGTTAARRSVVLLLAAAAALVAREGGRARAASGRDTLKSRLGDKASDEQRVDDCGVPPERRGPRERPDGCAHRKGSGTTAPRP